MASAAVQSQPHAPTFATPFTQPQPKELPKAKPEGRNVTAEVNYYKDQGGPPPPAYIGRPETYYRPADTRTVTVHDVRGRESEYTLDGNGFQFAQHTSVEKDFLDEDKIKRDYYSEIEQLLKKTTGASKIHIFDHTIRRPPPATEAGAQLDRDMTRGPVQQVHIDQSYKAGPERVQYHFPDAGEHERLLRGRYQIINVWRPIKPILKDPLGVADAGSVPDHDLLPVQLIYPDRVGETFTVKPNEAHKWYYLFGQQPDEVLFIKCFDSLVDGRARRVPHTSFVDAEFEDGVPRESIEVRALVFHEPEE